MTNNVNNEVRAKEIVEERAKERVENLRRLLSKSITRLNDANELFRYECKVFGWDEDLAFDISETIGKLGVHLASISQWFDDEEEDKENRK